MLATACMSNELTIVSLFAVPIAALLWAAARTQCRVMRGQESGHLRKPTNAETAVGVAALAAALGFLY